MKVDREGHGLHPTTLPPRVRHEAVERLAWPAQMVPVLVRVCAAALKGAPEVGEHVLRAHAAQNFARVLAQRALQQDDLIEPRVRRAERGTVGRGAAPYEGHLCGLADN